MGIATATEPARMRSEWVTGAIPAAPATQAAQVAIRRHIAGAIPLECGRLPAKGVR